MPNLERHIFVCTNERPAGHPKGCCKDKGCALVRDRLKKVVAAAGLKGKVRANRAGCLGQCEHGVAFVVYPEQVWYGGVTVDDVQEIVDRHLVGGEIVTRLLMEGESEPDGDV